MPVSVAYSDTIDGCENGRSMKDVFAELERDQDRLDNSDRSRQLEAHEAMIM
jgi:hypothetical protein